MSPSVRTVEVWYASGGWRDAVSTCSVTDACGRWESGAKHMRTTKRGRPAVAIAIVVGTLGSANLPATLAAPGDIYNLGTLDTSPAVTFSQGFGINDAGQVAGVSVTGELDPPSGDPIHHAFRYTGTPGSGGAMVDLGALGETYS